MGDEHNASPRSPWASWRLRIRAESEDAPRTGESEDAPRTVIRGAGILVGRDLALTSAHVLPHQDAVVQVEFPEYEYVPGGGSVPPVPARPAEGGQPRGPGGQDRDIVLLALDRTPEHARPARLSLATPYPGRKVWIGGYPEYRDRGLWLHAQVAGPSQGLLELHPLDGGDSVRPGFSGAAVIDDSGPDGDGAAEGGAVLGMIVSRYGDPEGSGVQQELHRSYMIPVERIVDLLPQLRGLPAGVRAHDASLSAPRERPPAPGSSGSRLERRLERWLTADATLPRPGVLLVATGGVGQREARVRQFLESTDVALDATGLGAGRLAGEIASRLGLPGRHGRALLEWLTEEHGSPPGLSSTSHDPVDDAARSSGLSRLARLSPTIGVYGLDLAAEPYESINVLRRLRRTGCRVCVVCRHDDGGVWRQLLTRLQNPELRKTAGELLDTLRELEHGARHRPSPYGTPAPEVVTARALRLAGTGQVPDPDQQHLGLRTLVRELYADIAGHGTE
ncbi:trypsin-like peptidase domain-containing protein [Streptomyces sp. HNM0575]|uniref:S1 family peptidase n=1 Tax=Streptomyces sp. HNM0575 TaxID=2716338 RepID=UPI00145FAA64|nr:serine protease [Streptomyces sp. HNM0575]NLU74613.1 trypsin-like peptidase domain-containing protein [Streptomyces sp. HNM0575]